MAIVHAPISSQIILNFLQMVSLAAGLPLQWPSSVDAMLSIMSVISSAGSTLLVPDCELTHIATSDAFFMKQIAFTFLVPMIIVICIMVWSIIHVSCSCCKRVKWRDTKTNCILSVVLMLFLSYPMLTRMCLSMFKCPTVGGQRYLMADLEEPCFEGRHTIHMMLLSVPQIFLYILGLPASAFYILMRNKRHHDKAQFQLRYGLLYLG